MLGLERLQAAARLDQQIGGETWRERVLGERRLRREHDVGAGEPDDEAGHGVVTQIELGGLSFTERACESRSHLVLLTASSASGESS